MTGGHQSLSERSTKSAQNMIFLHQCRRRKKLKSCRLFADSTTPPENGSNNQLQPHRFLKAEKAKLTFAPAAAPGGSE